MNKPALLIAVAILTVLGAVAVAKQLMPSTSATAMNPNLAAPSRVASPVAPSETMAIVPAPVIDTNAEIFVGTGDGGGGAWIKR